MSERLRAVLSDLRSVSNETAKILDRMSGVSERLSKKTSATLLGAFGGLSGLSLAYLGSVWQPVSLALLGTLLSSGGILAGLLFHRGRRRFALERRIEENRLLPTSCSTASSTCPRVLHKKCVTSCGLRIVHSLAVSTSKLHTH